MIDIFCLLKKLIRRMHDKENFCREKLIVLNQSKVFCRYFLFIKKLMRKLHNKENSCRQENRVDTLSDDENASTAAQGCSWRRIEACNNTFSKWQGFDIRNKHLRKCIIVNTLRYIYYRPSLSSVSVSKSPVTSCTNCFLYPSRHAVPFEVDEPAGKPETTQVRARSKLNAKLKTHVLGVNHAETAGSVRFMAVYIFLSISRDMYCRILRLTNDRRNHYKNISNEF